MYKPEEDCAEMISRLKEICKQKNLTAYSLAKKSGISASTISYLLSGKTKPQVYTILMLCNALDIEIGSLFEDRSVCSEQKCAQAALPSMGSDNSITEEKLLEIRRKEELLRRCCSLSKENQELLEGFVGLLEQKEHLR